uniref:Palmitoyltransferase ZDHHC3 n=1 Tax=Phallusia mammillata TaxID=59560 RepID=A0A6F9DYG0_9ASCI|nr:palmitoyltransferase ZDHHC3 [Phallusia mammillata]
MLTVLSAFSFSLSGVSSGLVSMVFSISSECSELMISPIFPSSLFSVVTLRIRTAGVCSLLVLSFLFCFFVCPVLSEATVLFVVVSSSALVLFGFGSFVCSKVFSVTSVVPWVFSSLLSGACLSGSSVSVLFSDLSSAFSSTLPSVVPIEVSGLAFADLSVFAVVLLSFLFVESLTSVSVGSVVLNLVTTFAFVLFS